MTELLKTVRANHKFLMILTAVGLVLLIFIFQHTPYDSALSELQTLSVIKEIDVIDYFVRRNPDVFNSLPVLNECWKFDGSFESYLSSITSATFLEEKISCKEYFRSMFELNFPYNDSLHLWMEWVGNGADGYWAKCDESKISWSPFPPNNIAESLIIVGYSFGYIGDNDDSQLDKDEKIFFSKIQFIDSKNKNWTHEQATELIMKMPANIIHSFFGSDGWVTSLGFRDFITHEYANLPTLFGGIKTLELDKQNLTISDAINNVLRLEESNNKINVLGMYIPQSLATLLTPIAIIVTMINLSVQLMKLNSLCVGFNMTEIKYFPWIPLYNGFLAKVYSYVTILALPVAFSVILFMSGFSDNVTFSNSIGFFLITIFAILPALFSVNLVNKIRSKSYCQAPH